MATQCSGGDLSIVVKFMHLDDDDYDTVIFLVSFCNVTTETDQEMKGTVVLM